MKKAKLLSFLLTGALLFQTAGIDALAAAPADPLPAAETVLEPSQNVTDPLPDEGEDGVQNPEKDPDKVQEPEKEEDKAQDPEAGEEKTQAPAEDGDKAQDPEEGEDKTQAPAEDGDKAQDPETPEKDSDTTGEEEAPTEEDEEMTKDQEESSEAEEDPADSVSENTISDTTVSENTLPEEAENVFDIFPGLGDSYTLSSQQLADKRDLSAHMGDIIDINTANAGLFPDAEGLYELGEVVYLADTEAEAEQIAKAFGGKLDSYSYGVAVISLPEKATVSMAVAAAADSDSKLPAVWPNYYNYVDEDISPDAYNPSAGDPSYSIQWQHDYIGTRYAWRAGFKGQGVKVAVIDSGIQASHEDINAATGRNFCAKEAGSAAGPAYNVDNGSHGTHVAGIIAAIAGNGKGGAGIAPDATVRSYCVMTKASGGRSGSAADIMRAINAAAEDGNDIINMSLGSPIYDGQYAQVVDKAYKKGVAIFASAGNDDSDGNNFPAAYPGTISVGAVDQNGARASFSNFGGTVNLSFPGVSIYSTVPTGYGYMSGTSQASPAAAGTAAVILSADASIQGKSGKARVDALLAKMKSSTTKSSGSGMGAGTTWLPGALKIATDATAPDAPVITIAQTPSPGKTYVAEAVTVSITPNTDAYYVDIWYSTDGKNPTYKSGAVTNAVKYTGPFSLGGAKAKTVKAIAVNPYTGMVSKAASKTCTLTPIPAAVTVTSAGNVSRIAVGKSLKLTAAVTPSYAVSTKVAWSVNDAASAAGITVTNGTVKTKNTTPAGKYTVTATAVGSDGASYNGVKGTYELEVIAKADIKKVAFLDSKGKAYNKQNMNQGQTLDLKPYLKVTKQDNSEGAVTDVVWSSSNPNAAAVTADGIVTAKAPGKAVIKATSNDGGNKSASCTVTVNQPITGITLSGPAKVASGGSITLKATITPANATNKNLTWAVAGNDNITVSTSGKVTAKKGASGSCTITATAKDGSAVSSAAYTVTVLSGGITKITLSNQNMTLFSRQANAQTPVSSTLTANVEGNAGYDKTLIAWSSSAPGVASVVNGVVTAHTAGKAVITCAATDGSNKKATCTVNVSIPMSKLVIGTSGRNGSGYIAQGKSIRLSAKYYNYYGKPSNTKVTWQSSNENIAKVDKNGKVTAVKTAAVGSKAIITAIAADGSNVVSNSYTVTVSTLYKKMALLFDSRPTGGGFVPVIYDADGDTYTTSDFTVSVSGGKNPGCYKGNYNNLFNYLQPIPGAVTTNKSSSSTKLTTSDLQSMKLTVKLQDGSGLSATISVYVARFRDGSIGYFK